MPPVVSALYVYPIKSCRGVNLPSVLVEERGFRLDRRWMLINQEGIFLSQRSLPRMALLEVHIQEDHLDVHAPAMEPLTIPLEAASASDTRVVIWSDTVLAQSYDAQINSWFSAFLGIQCRLVKFPEHMRRPVDSRYAKNKEHTGFADGYPFLLTSEASLEHLNSRLADPVPMNRFRPNIVVRNCSPFAEDDWRSIRIGSVKFRMAKPCARCRVITVDQNTAVVTDEPLRTLGQYRSDGTKVLFGQNLLHVGSGTLHVGDSIQIIEQGRSNGN